MHKFLVVLVFTCFVGQGCCVPATFNILSYGARPDAGTNNAAYIQTAIDAAAKAGGGRVLVPAGRFITGPVELKTGVHLYLAKDAALLASTSRLDYGKGSAVALLHARNQHHISITGQGEIDGRGRELVKDLYRLLRAGTLQDPQYNTKRPTEANRPKLIELIACTGITVKGITIKNGSSWIQDYVRCDSVLIDSITVISTEYWNNDGIDITNSANVTIRNCYVDAADDAICLKSEGLPGICENVTVSSCRLRSSASAFKLGTGSKGGFRNISVRDLTIFDTYRSAIALEAVDGGFLENIDIRHVKAINTGNAILIRLGHRNSSYSFSTIKHIRISDIDVQVPGNKPDIGYPLEGPALKYPHNVFPSSVTGIPGHAVEDVVLKDITIRYDGVGDTAIAHFAWDSLLRVPENIPGYPEFSMFGELPAWGFYARHVKGLVLQNVRLLLAKTDYRPAAVFDDVTALKLDGLSIPVCNTNPVIVFNAVPAPSLAGLELPAGKGKGIEILK